MELRKQVEQQTLMVNPLGTEFNEFLRWEQAWLKTHVDQMYRMYSSMLDALASSNKISGDMERELNLPRCTGRMSGRHCIHGMGVSCPMHGEPPEGGRLRVSVKSGEIEAVSEAIKKHDYTRRLYVLLDRKRRDLNHERSKLGLKSTNFPFVIPEEVR